MSRRKANNTTTKTYDMKISTLQLLTLTLLSLSSGLGYSQSKSFWVKVKDPSVFHSSEWNQIKSNLEIRDLSLALPASRNPELLKIYSFECNCNQEQLSNDLRKFDNNFYQLNRGPKYEALYVPNDYSNIQAVDYSLNLINAPQAWDLTHGDDSVVIAISDQNYYPLHEDLEGKIVHYDPNNTATQTHGTAVAVVAAGNTDNGIGLSSIGFNSSLGLYKMDLNDVLLAAYNGSDIINISWTTGCSFSQLEQDVMDEVTAQGSFIIASAGNGATCGGAGALVYPASYNHVFSVTSVGPQNNHEKIIGDNTSTHQHNDSVDLAAPGYDVAVSPAPGWYINSSGSSFASAYVSGTVALMLAVNKCISNIEIENILKNTSYPLDNINPLYATQIGAGRLDAYQAVLAAMNIANPITPTFTLGDDCIALDASASLTIQGGQEPYQISWSNGYQGLNNSGLSTNTYFVQIVDAHGCRLDTLVNVIDVIPPSYNYLIANPTCAGSDNGGIQFNVTNTTSVSIVWSNGSIGNQIMDLPEGSYEAIIHFGNNCTISEWFSLVAPDPIQVVGNITSITNGGQGAIDLLVNGGTAPYSFSWDNGSNTEDLNSLTAGNYTVNITDANGCQFSEQFSVENISNTGGIDSEENINIFPNPNNGIFQISGDPGVNYQVVIFDNQGRQIKGVDFTGNLQIDQKLSSGEYFLVITNNQTQNMKTFKCIVL